MGRCTSRKKVAENYYKRTTRIKLSICIGRNDGMLMMLVGVVTADVQELAQNSLLYLTQEKKTKNIGYTQL